MRNIRQEIPRALRALIVGKNLGGFVRRLNAVLNHDTAALNALRKPFVGFNRSTGAFQPTQVMARPDWNFIYHLHGSVHHCIRKESTTQEDADFGQKITWYNDLTQAGDGEEWTDAGDITTKTDGKRVLMSSLMAGGWKLDQLQEEPFLTFYSCFPARSTKPMRS